MQRKPSLRLLLFLVVSMSMTELLQAQGTPPPFRKLDRAAVTAAPAIVKEDYGVQDYNFTIIPASDFRPFDSATGYTVSVANGALTRTGGGGQSFSHVITLPPGVILADMTAYISDTNATSDVYLYLAVGYRETDTGHFLGWGNYAQAHSSGAPGLTTIVIPWGGTLGARYSVLSDGVVDDVDWVVVVNLPTTDATTSFNGVRLRWKRQISPDPTTATFTDVPVGHPFHRFVEALAASGITFGCGGGNFCPDAPVTRGQMAVFLAGALGLHWAP